MSSGHRVRLQNRRSRVWIPPGCNVFRSFNISVLLSKLNMHCYCVFLRKYIQRILCLHFNLKQYNNDTIKKLNAFKLWTQRDFFRTDNFVSAYIRVPITTGAKKCWPNLKARPTWIAFVILLLMREIGTKEKNLVFAPLKKRRRHSTFQHRWKLRPLCS
jgi:hypothetical protein